MCHSYMGHLYTTMTTVVEVVIGDCKLGVGRGAGGVVELGHQCLLGPDHMLTAGMFVPTAIGTEDHNWTLAFLWTFIQDGHKCDKPSV